MERSYQQWRNDFNFTEDLSELEQLLPIDNEEEAMRIYEDRLRRRVVQSKDPLPESKLGFRHEGNRRSTQRREPFTYNTYQDNSQNIDLPGESALTDRLRHTKYRAPIPQRPQPEAQQPARPETRRNRPTPQTRVYSQKELLAQPSENNLYQDNVAMAKQIEKLLKENKSLRMELDYRDAELHRYKQVFGNWYLKRES